MSINVTPARPCYGAFQDTTTQTIASASEVYPVKFNTTDFSRGISCVTDGSNLTRITSAKSGLYNFQFSFQLVNASTTSEQDVDIWWRVNGVDVPSSNSTVTIPKVHGGVLGALIPAWNFFVYITNGDYVQVMWRASGTDVSMPYVAAKSSPSRPATPSAILTVSQVD